MAEQEIWSSSHLLCQLEVIPSQSDLAEQVALQVWAELLGLNHDSARLESISACLEEAVGHHKGLLLETEGAVAVGLLEQRVRVELLELALRRV